MNIFLTGGGGFISKNLIEQLDDKYNITSPTHQELDLLDTAKVDAFFKKNLFDIILHTANTGGKRSEIDNRDIVDINLRIFLNIIRNKDKVKKIITLGSGAEYDKSRNIADVKEKEFGKQIPKDQYGFYKYVCSKLIEPTDNIINLRLFGIYGKYEDYNSRFISYAICQNLAGLPIVINQNVFFDYLYINDLIKIIDFFIVTGTKEKFFNVGSGKKIDLLTIAKTINELVKQKSKIVIKQKGLQKEYTCSNKLLLKAMNGFTFTDFKKSLQELYDYYKRIDK